MTGLNIETIVLLFFFRGEKWVPVKGNNPRSDEFSKFQVMASTLFPSKKCQNTI